MDDVDTSDTYSTDINSSDDSSDINKNDDNKVDVMIRINKTLQNALLISYQEKCKLENLLKNASLQLWYLRGQTVPYENPFS